MHPTRTVLRASKDKVENQQILSTQFGITVFVYFLLGLFKISYCVNTANMKIHVILCLSCFFPIL
jgi:hypothetical protein